MEKEQVSWEQGYKVAKQYQAIYGNLTMSMRTEIEGLKLHDWLEEQRDAHKKGELSLSREVKLLELDPKWYVSKAKNIPFNEKTVAYYLAQVFPDLIETYRPACLRGKELDMYIPSLNIGIEYDGGRFHRLENDLHKNQLCAEGGIPLIRIRDELAGYLQADENCTIIKRYSNSNRDFKRTLKVLFKQLGVTDMPDINLERDRPIIENGQLEKETRFDQYLLSAKYYYQENGHLFVPKSYVDPTGTRLGQWIHSVREFKDNLFETQKNALDDIGMVWEDVKKEKWLYNFHSAIQYDEIPEDAVNTDGQSLKEWFDRQKEKYENFEMYDEYKFNAMYDRFGLECEREYEAQIEPKENSKKDKPKSRGSDFEL